MLESIESAGRFAGEVPLGSHPRCLAVFVFMTPSRFLMRGGPRSGTVVCTRSMSHLLQEKLNRDYCGLNSDDSLQLSAEASTYSFPRASSCMMCALRPLQVELKY